MRHLAFFLALVPAAAQVTVTAVSDRVTIDIDGKPFSALFVGASVKKPYLHPLRAASGTVVSRMFPMEAVDGESRDHPHHRGLWFTHGDVNGIDFWIEGEQPKHGKIVLKKIAEVKSGKKSGSLTALFDWNTQKGETLLSETRRMVFHSHPTLRLIDVDITLSPRGKVVFGDTKEGTFAIRLAEPLTEKKGTAHMISADGKTGMKEVWGKRAPWVDYNGKIGDEPLGVAIFDHPTNPKHPTYWHARDYGLFAANPFGEHDFYNDKTRNGSLTLEPGVPVRFRYRVVIHPGDEKTAGIAELYKKFASEK
ncbi:MAG: PmoA family protein [Bryobacteraceae bacterium]|nr:PmoA family protein [Bryobacteraceae bacterium]